MSDLVEFLRARLADDERVARAATAGPWRVVYGDHHWAATVDGPDVLQDGGYDEATKSRRQVMRPVQVIPPDVDYGAVVDLGDAEHIARHDPARVLADVASTRKTIALHATELGHECVSDAGSSLVGYYTDDDPCPTFRALALRYASDPAYREEWRP